VPCPVDLSRWAGNVGGLPRGRGLLLESEPRAGVDA
jgi:hypothetical protein